MAAGIAVDAGEAVVRVAALNETLDHPFLERASKAPGRAQLPCVAHGTLVERARAWLARAINTAFWRTPRCSSTWLAAS